MSWHYWTILVGRGPGHANVIMVIVWSPPCPCPCPCPLPRVLIRVYSSWLVACIPRLLARTSFGPAQPQHCPHYCWQGMHGLPKCGSALVTMLLLVCLAGPSTSGRPASSTPWGWESARAPPRAVSFQQYLPSFAWIRGISQIPDVAELRQVFLFLYFMLSLDTWHLSDTPMQLSSIDVHMLWYVLQFLVSPGAVYLPQGSSLHLHWLAPLHAVHQPFCYQAPSHCKGQPFAAYGLSWCSAHALTAWVSVKWLSPLNTPATGLPGYSAHPCAQHRSIPKPQPYSPWVFQAVQWSNPLPPLTFFFSSLQLLVLWAPPGPHPMAPYGLQLLPSWDTRSHGRNACLTRMPLSALRVAPAALPATRGMTPAAYGCPVCAAHSLVRHPQPMSATRVPPAAGPATCAAPAASARTLAPARYVCLACDTRSLCLPCVLTPAAYACIVCSPAALDCNACNTRKHWPALCEHPRMVRDACLSPNPGGAARTGRLLAVHLHAKVPNPMGGCLRPPWPQRVSHPQTPVCLALSTRSPGPAPCAAPAAIARNWHLHATSASCVIRPCIIPAAQACTVWPSAALDCNVCNTCKLRLASCEHPRMARRRDSCSPFGLVMPTLDKAACKMDIWTLTACGAFASWRANSMGCATS